MTHGFWYYAVLSIAIAAAVFYIGLALAIMVRWYLRRSVALRIDVFDFLAQQLLNDDQLEYLRSKYRQIWHPRREPLLKDKVLLYMKGDFTHMTGDFLGKKPQEYEINWREISEAEDRYHKELAEWHSKLRVAKKEKLTLISRDCLKTGFFVRILVDHFT